MHPAHIHSEKLNFNAEEEEFGVHILFAISSYYESVKAVIATV